MKKTFVALVPSIVLLLAFGCEITNIADANWMGVFAGLPSITIQRDGSVVPQTEFIKQVGNVYSLEYDMLKEYVVKINCSNIIFDGQGHCINGSMEFFYGGASQNYYSSGIALDGVSNVTIRNITICSFTKPCIYIYKCSGISVLGAQIDEVCIEDSNYNTVSNCVTGVEIRSGSYNTIFRNSLTLHFDSSNNLVYQNNINVRYASRGDPYPIVSWGLTDSWDNDVVGNYWSDYSTKYHNASEIGNSGISDTPYVIDANNKDNYPLMEPVVIPQIARVVASPVPLNISIFSPENILYNSSSVPLNFSVNKPSSNMSYSLDGQQNITFSGNTNLTDISNGLHNITVYAQDTFGNTCSSQTVSFTVAKPEPEPFPVAPVSAVAVAAIALAIVLSLLLFRRHQKSASLSK